MESERKLSSIHPEKALETHEIFYPEKSLRNQDTVRCDRHSVTFVHLVEGIITYTLMTPLLT